MILKRNLRDMSFMITLPDEGVDLQGGCQIDWSSV